MAKAHDELTGILKKDHQEVKAIFGKLEKEKDAGTREELLDQLSRVLEPHLSAEEEAFYPALQKTGEGKETALQALEEHHVTKLVLEEVMDMAGSEESFKAKTTVLKELVFHHIQEEESEVFKIFNKVIKNDEARQVLEDFREAKSSRMAALEEESEMT
ncbi:MAG: hemerythrin domain-containing protein [Desulfobacteraceae bacterium]|nr:hemerythrin domain-containing protein [Desulfobacteraceae bacterium]